MDEHVVTRLGHRGDGIADGPVYIPLTLPGERVAGIRDGDMLRDTRILAPSSDRVKPPCRHFKACGGCQLQHASDAFLRVWKEDVVRTALRAHDITAEFLPTAVSPPRSRRRATVTARRTKGGAVAGFLGRASDVIVDVTECHLLHPDLLAVLPLAKALAKTGGSRKGEIKVAATVADAGLDVTVRGGKPLDGPLRIDLAGLAAEHDLARLCWEDEVLVTRRDPVVSFGGVAVVPPSGAFLQATDPGEAALRRDVADIVDGAGRVVDLFAGCGTFALPLAADSAVHAVEGASDMTDALDKGWRRATGLKRVTHEVRDLFRNPLTAKELTRFDAAVIDPPRAGAAAQIAELGQAAVPVIAYVSCNPVSFARDARHLLDQGYELTRLRVVDQFRWSNHVELVAGFVINS